MVEIMKSALDLVVDALRLVEGHNPKGRVDTRQIEVIGDLNLDPLVVLHDPGRVALAPEFLHPAVYPRLR